MMEVKSPRSGLRFGHGGLEQAGRWGSGGADISYPSFQCVMKQLSNKKLKFEVETMFQ